MRLYGLKTCDTCKKALKALDAAGHAPEFVDLRATPVPPEQIADWLGAFGEEALVNRRSTTWRGLDEVDRARPAQELLVAHPTLIKRPVIEDGTRKSVGWDAAAQRLHLG